MDTQPISLATHWSPFEAHTAANAFADLQTVAGVTVEPLRFGGTPDNVSLSPQGQVYDKTVVSEVTTVTIHSNTSYRVVTESADAAAKAKADGTALDSASNGAGSVNVASADNSSRLNNTGSISVETVVTYSDGSTERSIAGLSDGSLATGSGLARKRLDSLVGTSLSESALLKRLGAAQADGGASKAAHDAPAGVAIDASVSADVNLSLTYVSQGDQHSVTGVESGSATATIAAFRADDLSYDAAGALSTTRESMNFSAIVKSGALFGQNSAPWVAGALDESTKSVTHVNGPNDLTVAQQSTAYAEFGTSPTSTLAGSGSSTATQISFDALLANGAGGVDHAQFTLDASTSAGSLQFTQGDRSTTHDWQKTSPTSLAIELTTIVPPAGGATGPATASFTALA